MVYIYICIQSLYINFAGKSPNIQSYTVYIYAALAVLI